MVLFVIPSLKVFYSWLKKEEEEKTCWNWFVDTFQNKKNKKLSNPFWTGFRLKLWDKCWLPAFITSVKKPLFPLTEWFKSCQSQWVIPLVLSLPTQDYLSMRRDLMIWHSAFNSRFWLWTSQDCLLWQTCGNVSLSLVKNHSELLVDKLTSSNRAAAAALSPLSATLQFNYPGRDCLVSN